MDIFQNFKASTAILKESIKILSKNGRLMSLIALISAGLYSSLFLFLNFSTNSLVNDMISKQYSPVLYPSSGTITDPDAAALAAAAAAANNPFIAMMKDAKLIFLVNVSFLVGIYVLSFCTSVATVIASAAACDEFSGGRKESSISSLQKFASWENNIKPGLITSFYTTLLSTGYFFIFSVVIISPPLMYFVTAGNTLFTTFAIFSVIMTSVIYTYLNVEWILALVISIIEEKNNNNYGIQGLGRAGALISNTEGKKIQGFILNLFFNMVSWVLSVVFIIILGKNQTTALWVYGSVVLSLVKIMQLISYTVLYFECVQKEFGEEIVELQSGVVVGGYRKISPQPPFSDAA